MTDAELTELLASYRPSDTAVRAVQSARIVLLVGITGAGKNTLKQELLKDDEFYDFISHTTRPARSNLGVMEQDGVDYFFISTDKAVELLRAGEYIEAKKVHANIYGTALEGLRPSIDVGRIAVNDVDVQGVDEYKTMSSNVHAIFVLPPSFDEWNHRRLARYDGDIDPADNAIRLESAKMEIEFALNKGYYDFLINDDVKQAADRVRDIVAGKGDSKSHADAEALARSLYDDLGTH